MNDDIERAELELGPAEAVRRDAGPTPDFVLVRPYVESIGGAPGGASHRSIVTGALIDETQELPLSAIRPVHRPVAVAASTRPASWFRPFLIVTVICTVITGLTTAYLLHTPDRPAAASLPPAGAIAPLFPLTSPSPSVHGSAVSSATPESRIGAPASAPQSGAPASPSAVSPSASASAPFGTQHGSSAPKTPAATPTTSSLAPPVPPTPTPTIAPPPSTAVSGAIVNSDGLCLDDNGRVTPNGNAIQLFQCNGSPAQVWTFQTDSTVQVLGKCLQVTQPVNGGRTELWDCDGSKSEAWRVGPSHSLINLVSGLCLDNPESGYWGIRLYITPCTGQSSQAWSLPTFTS